MKIFLDTANIDEIKEGASWGIVDGVTTNPSLISKEKRDFKGIKPKIFTASIFLPFHLHFAKMMSKISEEKSCHKNFLKNSPS